MDNAKERLFKFLDDMIDRDIDVLKLRRTLPEKEYESVRKRFRRTFGSYNQGLIEYGFYSNNGSPSDVEIAFDLPDAKLRHVSVLYPLLKRNGRADLVEDMESFISAIGEDTCYWRIKDENKRENYAANSGRLHYLYTPRFKTFS